MKAFEIGVSGFRITFGVVEQEDNSPLGALRDLERLIDEGAALLESDSVVGEWARQGMEGVQSMAAMAFARMDHGLMAEDLPPASTPAPSPEDLARAFHEAYERLAPEFGYETRDRSAVPWDDVPADNRGLMVATAASVLDDLRRGVDLAQAGKVAGEGLP